MSKAGLNAEAVTRAAAAIVDADGVAALTLARLAGDLRVAPPSLYKHIGGLNDLIDRLTLLAIRQLADELTAAALGRSGREALIVVSQAYRRYALGRASLYSLIQGTLRNGATLQHSAVTRIITVLGAIVRGYNVADHKTIHAIRIVRSGLHGFCDIEARGGLQLSDSVDESFSLLVDALDAALCRLGTVH